VNQLLVVEYDGNSNNSANEIALKKFLKCIEKKNNKILRLLIPLYVISVIGFIIIFDKEIHLAIRLIDILIICFTVIIALVRRVGLKKNIENKYKIYNKHKKFRLTFYDTFLEFNVDNKYIIKISYLKFKELYGTKDMFLINSTCCIYKNCVDDNVYNEIENILMDKLGDRYKQLDIK
jgi:hypothetical protein